MINNIMKNLIIIFLFIFLIGCSLVAPKYDNNEYLLLTEIETNSRMLVSECANPGKVILRLDKLVNTVETFFTYTFYIPNNDDTYEIAKVLRQNVYEIQNRYQQNPPPSKAYCGIKAKILVQTSQRALEAVGAKVK